MEKTRLELFHTLQRPQVREVQREDGTKAERFEGYAIVFNEWSVVMLDDGKMFRERLLPEAVTQELIDSLDIVCTRSHKPDPILARHTPDGLGTMKMVVDGTGVLVAFDFPNSPSGQDTREGVKRGDYPGMSFTFYEGLYTFTDKKGSDGIIERTISKIDYIDEVTVAGHPAYPATTAKSREAWVNLLTPEEEKEREAKARAEAKAKAEREFADYCDELDAELLIHQRRSLD